MQKEAKIYVTGKTFCSSHKSNENIKMIASLRSTWSMEKNSASFLEKKRWYIRAICFLFLIVLQVLLNIREFSLKALMDVPIEVLDSTACQSFYQFWAY